MKELSVAQGVVPTADFIGAVCRRWVEKSPHGCMKHARESIQKVCFILKFKKLLPVEDDITYEYDYGVGVYYISYQILFAMGTARKGKDYLTHSEVESPNSDPRLIGSDLTITEKAPIFKDSTKSRRIIKVIDILAPLPIVYLKLLVSAVASSIDDAFESNPKFSKGNHREIIENLLKQIEEA